MLHEGRSELPLSAGSLAGTQVLASQLLVQLFAQSPSMPETHFSRGRLLICRISVGH